MAIVGTAKERPDSPTTEVTLNQRKYLRHWRVQTNDYADGPAIVTHAPGLPRLYTPYVFGNEFDFYAVLREYSAERVQPNSLFWIVTGHYSTPEPFRHDMPSGSKRDTTGANDNPLLQLPEVETTFEKFQEVIWYVYDERTGTFRPPMNSAEEVFIPPLTRDASRLVLTISRNEDIASNHPAADIAYIDAVNSDVWWGCQPGTWKCMAISARREQKMLANVGIILAYLKVTYKFEARPTWDLQILDQGNYYYDGGNQSSTFGDIKKAARKFITSDSHPTVGPLDGTGDKLEPGEDFVFLTLRTYKRLPFSALTLPQSFQQVA